jgi:hypothetical protein
MCDTEFLTYVCPGAGSPRMCHVVLPRPLGSSRSLHYLCICRASVFKLKEHKAVLRNGQFGPIPFYRIMRVSTE